MASKHLPMIFSILVLAFISVTLLIEITLNPTGGPIIAGIAGITGETGCAGSPSVILIPNIVAAGEQVTAEFSGFSSCYGKIVFLRHQTVDNNDLELSCSCVLEDGNQCSCAFAAPSYLCSSNIFYAQIDKNGNGDFNDLGESNIIRLYTSQVC